MQRIMNDPDNIVDEMLQGFLKTHSDLVERSENGRVVRSAHMDRDAPALWRVAAAAISRLLSAMWAKGCVMRLPWVKFVPPHCRCISGCLSRGGSRAGRRLSVRELLRRQSEC